MKILVSACMWLSFASVPHDAETKAIYGNLNNGGIRETIVMLGDSDHPCDTVSKSITWHNSSTVVTLHLRNSDNSPVCMGSYLILDQGTYQQDSSTKPFHRAFGEWQTRILSERSASAEGGSVSNGAVAILTGDSSRQESLKAEMAFNLESHLRYGASTLIEHCELLDSTVR